jgi:4-hydroxyacetophenone monooxygenase
MSTSRDPVRLGEGTHALSDDALRRALEAANLPTLLLTLAHLTGDAAWLEEPLCPTRAQGLAAHDDGGFAPEIQERIRREAFDVLRTLERDGVDPATIVAPEPAQVARMLAISLHEPVSEDYGDLLAEELGVASRAIEPPPVPGDRDFRVVVIGGGLSGLCAAVMLQRAGIDFVVVDKNADVGGTWNENRYPGCGVDTPSHLYSFSFDQNLGWTRFFSKRDELFAYWQRVAAGAGVLGNFRFETAVTLAEFDESTNRWRVHTTDAAGTEDVIDATVVISAVGLLNRPFVPELPGIENFQGPVVHTSHWPDDVDITGKNVAVIGTGASAMQFVPAAAGVAELVTVFQRTPQWAVPHPTYQRSVTPEQQDLMTHVPYYANWFRLRQFWTFGDRGHAMLQIDPEWPHQDRSINLINDRFRDFLTAYMERELEGRPDLIEKSRPSYPPYGKRPLLDNGWYRTIRRDDVELVTEAISTIREDAVVTASGDVHPADVLVMATGFKALDMLGHVTVRGRNGLLLSDVWKDDDARAHLGISVPGFPNFFCLFGPNTATGHGGTQVLTSELQVRYVMQLLARMVEDDLEAVECRQEAFDDYNASLDEALSHTIWMHKGMTTYYRNTAGRVVAAMPWKYLQYWQLTRRPDLADFELVRRGEPVAVSAD